MAKMNRLSYDAAWDAELLDHVTGKKAFGEKPIDPHEIISRLLRQAQKQEEALDQMGATILRIISQVKLTDPVTRGMVRDVMRQAATDDDDAQDVDPARSGCLSIYIACGPAFRTNLEGTLRRALRELPPASPSHQVIFRLVEALDEAEYYQHPEPGAPT